MEADLQIGCYTWTRVGYKVDNFEAMDELSTAYDSFRESKGLPKKQLISVLKIATDRDSESDTIGKIFLSLAKVNKKQLIMMMMETLVK